MARNFRDLSEREILALATSPKTILIICMYLGGPMKRDGDKPGQVCAVFPAVNRGSDRLRKGFFSLTLAT